MFGCADWQAVGAVAEAFIQAPVSINVVTDHMAAVRALGQGRGEMIEGTRVNGRLARYVAMQPGAARVTRATKVKAH